MTYLYLSRDGQGIERDYIGKVPERIRVGGKVFRKYRILGASIHAYTPVGDEAKKLDHRHYRVNKEVAEGLANGTMREPDDRGVGGDKQPRSSTAQFNEMYRDAKQKAGGPLQF